MSFTEAAYSIRRKQRVGVKNILVTGAKGSIGEVLVPALQAEGHQVLATDVDTLDVTAPPNMLVKNFDVVYHLAADKHAPAGEEDPVRTTMVNAVGTFNVLQAFPRAKVILASTCKACDPETVYGATKLAAERAVLNAGGVALRYFNVRESAGNVFRLWEKLPVDQPIPFTDCWRYFISKDQAVALTLAALEFPSGRYTVDPGQPRHMAGVAAATYPGRGTVQIERRRGDRRREPLHANCETVTRIPGTGFLRITSPYDPVPALGEAA